MGDLVKEIILIITQFCGFLYCKASSPLRNPVIRLMFPLAPAAKAPTFDKIFFKIRYQAFFVSLMVVDYCTGLSAKSKVRWVFQCHSYPHRQLGNMISQLPDGHTFFGCGCQYLPLNFESILRVIPASLSNSFFECLIL
jgi:hypothetical protein